MPLNTNLLRAPAGIEMPDQLARMATVEQIRSSQANQETARLNQQARELELADKEEAKTILNQVTSELKSNEDIGNARGMIAGLQTHPNKIVRDVGARLKQDLDLYDAQESYIRAHPGKVQVGNLGGPDGQPAPVNNLAPQPGATNALVPDQFRQQLDAERQSAAQRARHWEMQALRDPKFAPQAKEARDYFNSFGKINAYEPGRLLMGGDASMMTPAAPETPPMSVRELKAYQLMSPSEKADYEKLQKIKGTNISVNATNTPAGKSLAEPVGKRAEASLVKAEGAADIMNTANTVREALNTGNVIAGPGAGIRTKFAQVLELAGVGDKEKLIATRTAIQGMADLTLQSRAELKGQGQITDAETKLLERARSGDIADMTIAELQTVVNVSQRLAGRLRSNHQTLMDTMKNDPAAADVFKYYTPTAPMPQALGEGKSPSQQAKDNSRTPLKDIFGAKKP
jgi:hypothetical protein